MTTQISTEKLELVQACLEDGWSQIEIYRTHSIAPTTIRRYFPGKGWTKKQGAQLGYQIMKAGKQ